MNTHVFIVDTTTFKYHLEYSFAGTGARDYVVDFNNNPHSELHHSIEGNLVLMISDSQRIRRGDFIIFYLQQHYPSKVYEGKFYGIFKATKDLSFLDNNNRDQFLKNELKKSLTFRTSIEPYEVYAKGVTEWEALDEIKNIQSPYQMLWSLIYRKLKANRGNTMITIYESERLFKLLRDKNRRQTLSGSNLTYDFSTQEIGLAGTRHAYSGRQETVNIIPRLINKYEEGKAFESHLQVYIVQSIGRNVNQSLDRCLAGGLPIEWIGNEVSCGVGMQRIDVMLSLVESNRKIVVPIELKPTEATTDNVIQIQRYVDWTEQYYIPNRISDIQPVLIAKKTEVKDSDSFKHTIKSFKGFNQKNPNCLDLKYIEFEIEGNSLVFTEIKY